MSEIKKMFLNCDELEVINIDDAFYLCIEQIPYMRPVINTNLDWDRLSLKPVTLAKLKTMSRSGLVRVAIATEPGLQFTTITRHPMLAGRKAKRVEKGWFEVYEAGEGWVWISEDCQFWLHP